MNRYLADFSFVFVLHIYHNIMCQRLVNLEWNVKADMSHFDFKQSAMMCFGILFHKGYRGE